MAPLRWLLTAMLAALFLEGPALAATDGCLEFKSPSKRLKCLVDESKAAGLVDVCFEALNNEVRWMCVARFAEFRHDETVCDTVSSPDDIPPYASVDNCRTHLAITFDKVELCDKIYNGTLADTCYYGVVEYAGGAAEICDKIHMPELKDLCVASIAKR